MSDREQAIRALDNLIAAMHDGHYSVAELCKQSVLAALTELRAERDTLREALRRIADYGCGCAGCRIARAALAPVPEQAAGE